MKSTSIRAAAACAAALLAAVGLTTAATTAGAADPVGLHVDGTRLVERSGTPFVARGVSHAHTWYASQTTTAIPAIRAAGANALRVVLSGGRWTANDADDVVRVIELCRTHELVCMLENHDTTGHGEQSGAVGLDRAADYWVSLAPVLRGTEDFVQINIGNEPTGNNEPQVTGWTAATAAAVVELRAAGLRHNIVVDAPNWGQDWKGIMRDTAATVAAADPDRNVLFSVHMYGVYAQASTITAYLDAFEAQGLPLVIGEFGHDHSDGDPDEATIMREAVERGIGYYGWSWSGNSGGVEYLDMVTGFDPDRRTAWGDLIFDGPNGIRATARTATFFEGATATPTATPTPTPTPTVTPTPSATPTATPPPTTAPGGTCTATLTVDNAWPGGFQATVRVTAGAAPLTRWSASFTLPDGASVTQAWNTVLVTAGSSSTASSTPWNGALAAGGTTSFGFLGAGRAPTGDVPVGCR